MVNAAKGFLYLQSGTAHVETVNEVGDDEKTTKRQKHYEMLLLLSLDRSLCRRVLEKEGRSSC